ncbi:MAG: type II toxin-antitoxin system RelE/ParE family toxin [Lentisphaerae bacterium]|nr:type II toxin-antitoxin system RelE/ParE family toxin [Lentisphaerota bacterium]
MTYTVFIRKSAQKNIARLASSLQDRIFHAIRELASNPRPVGVKKLAGREAWRIRTGEYRIIYEIYDDSRIVIVIVVGHRREVYR